MFRKKEAKKQQHFFQCTITILNHGLYGKVKIINNHLINAFEPPRDQPEIGVNQILNI